MHAGLSRKEFLKTLVIGAASAALPFRSSAQETPKALVLTIDDLKAFQKVAGLSFTDEELKEALQDVNDRLAGFTSVRSQPINERTQPPLVFTPWTSRPARGRRGSSARVEEVEELKRPSSDEDLAFMSVRELGYLIRTKQVTSVELTELSLKRLERYGDKLLCLVTLLRDQALAEARERDREIADGRVRGPLHGIPCGIKDLFAYRGAPTTWGAAPYKSQMLDYDSAVVEKLRDAGAVIVAKLSMGALAMGDMWFAGRTKNPWDTTQGSSGSSAGSASATAAGLVPFAIGTETLGSICSPSNVCRVTGLRPSFGRVSRYGAMELSYTMDKVGPICRSVEDCALVFAALAGRDDRDPSTVDRPFHYSTKRDLNGYKIGFILGKDEKAEERLAKDEVLKFLSGVGVSLSPIKIEPTPDGVVDVLDVEASSAFDAFTRGSQIQDLKNSAWPRAFRAARFVPGVEYLQAMRARTLLMRRFEEELGDLDCVVASGVGGSLLTITNLTGHPQVLVPNGVNDNGRSRSVSFIGRLYEEDRLLPVAHLYQRHAGYYMLRPDLTKIG